MKNLPDKIYLATTEEIQNLDNTFVGIAHSNLEDIIEPVEYIRKDAFVKKAVEHIDGLIEFLNEFGHQLKKERIIEDFKKHIEL
jgi:hypothetical protein